MVKSDIIPKSFRKLQFSSVAEFWLLVDIYELKLYYKTDDVEAEELGVSRRTVVRMKASLLDKGYITKEYDKNLRRHVYRACVGQTNTQEPAPAVLNDDWSPLD